MAKRRITLTSQEMNEINARTKTLEAQLSRANDRVEELEQGLHGLKNQIDADDSGKKPAALVTALETEIKLIINPPVKAKVELELEAALAD